MQLPRDADALNSTDRTEKVLNVLVASLQLSAAEAGKRSITHLIRRNMFASGRIQPNALRPQRLGGDQRSGTLAIGR